MPLSLDALTTTELLRIAVSGNAAAWTEILHRYEPAVAAMITSYRLQEADADDATQRTWLRMLENHQQIREPEALGGWLRTTARRECLRILDEQRRIEPLPMDNSSNPTSPTAGVELPDPRVDVERTVVDADQARHVNRMLATLPERSFVLISSLFADEPPGYAQLSATTGIPVGSIGPTRARALRTLRRLVDEGCAA